MIFRQLFHADSSTYTYLLADSSNKKAVVIDPVFETHLRDAALIDELGLKLLFALDTHLHADHVTGAWLMRQRYGAKIGISKSSGAEGADVYFRDGDRVPFGSHALEVRATPGHTNGCVTYVLDDHTMAFTGDALLIRGAGRTDFQEGNARQLYESIQRKIFDLPPETILYPAHDYEGRTATSVAEERQFNPRIGAERSLEDFVGYMDNLGLPHPKHLAIALPANKVCGKPDDDRPAPKLGNWAPVIRNFAGVVEVNAHWVHEHAGELQLLDVREPSEYTGELGHIEQARLVPLGHLADSLSELDQNAPTVVVCRSGGRSARGVLLLEKAGFSKVANLAGGMVRWRALGLPCS